MRVRVLVGLRAPQDGQQPKEEPKQADAGDTEVAGDVPDVGLGDDSDDEAPAAPKAKKARKTYEDLTKHGDAPPSDISGSPQTHPRQPRLPEEEQPAPAPTHKRWRSGLFQQAPIRGGGDGDARINIRGFNQRNIAEMIDGVAVNDMENGWVYCSNWFGLSSVTSNTQV